MVLPVFIYALVSTRDDRPCYVGQSLDVPGRLKIHLQCLNCADDRRDAAATFGKPVYDWIKREHGAGFQIEARILEETPNKFEADTRERFWISELRSKGFALHNSTSGNGNRVATWREKSLLQQREQLMRDRAWVEQTINS